MSKSRKNRTAKPRPASAVHPEMLAQYCRAARAPTMREENRALMLLIEDYETLEETGQMAYALGVGLELVDLGLRIAATPSANALERQYKAGLFAAQHFGSWMKSLDHGHVERIAYAAVAADQTLAEDHPNAHQ